MQIRCEGEIKAQGLRCQHFRTIRVSKEFLAGGMNAAFSSDGQSSLKQSFFFSSSLTRPYDATILPARALRLMDRPMHLWQSVHIDHHHCLHMEGRGAWGGGSDRAACRCRTCCVLKLLKGRHPRVYYHVHLHAAVEGWRSIISYDWQYTESDTVIDRTANEHGVLLINDEPFELAWLQNYGKIKWS